MKKAGLDPQLVDVVVVSHLHGHVFGGLAFLLREALFQGRTRPLTVAGPPGVRARVEAATEPLVTDTIARVGFELRFLEWQDRGPVDVDGIRCTPFEVSNPSGAPAFALRIEAEGRSLGYSGDTAWTPILLDVARGTDLFLCEAYTLSRPLRSHLDYETIRRQSFGSKRMLLVHLGPKTRDASASLGIPRADDRMVLDV